MFEEKTFMNTAYRVSELIRYGRIPRINNPTLMFKKIKTIYGVKNSFGEENSFSVRSGQYNY
jgi:hypothetical protein